MNQQLSCYRNELYLNATTAAFIRDAIPGQFQLHWHFAGKTAGLMNGKSMTMEEVLVKFSESSVVIEQHLADNAWREWNQAYGCIDGIAEVIAAMQLARSEAVELPAPDVKLLRNALQPGASEYLRELAKAFAQAHRYGSSFAMDRPLRWYFGGKAKALRYAHSKTVKVLEDEFDAARYRAHREARDWRELQNQRGLSAGFAEAAALARLTTAFRHAARA